MPCKALLRTMKLSGSSTQESGIASLSGSQRTHPRSWATPSRSSKRRPRRTSSPLVAAAASVGLWGANQAAEPVTDVTYKFVFDDGLFGNSKEDSDGEEDDTPTSTETTTSTSTSSCNPEATVNANSVCILFDCQQLSTACASC